MGVQVIQTASGEELVVLTRRDYIALLARAGDEDAEDAMTIIIAEERRNDTMLTPAETRAIFDRILSHAA